MTAGHHRDLFDGLWTDPADDPGAFRRRASRRTGREDVTLVSSGEWLTYMQFIASVHRC